MTYSYGVPPRVAKVTRARSCKTHFTNVLRCLKLVRRKIYLGNLCIDLLNKCHRIIIPVWSCSLFQVSFRYVFFLNLSRSLSLRKRGKLHIWTLKVLKFLFLTLPSIKRRFLKLTCGISVSRCHCVSLWCLFNEWRRLLGSSDRLLAGKWSLQVLTCKSLCYVKLTLSRIFCARFLVAAIVSFERVVCEIWYMKR